MRLTLILSKYSVNTHQLFSGCNGLPWTEKENIICIFVFLIRRRLLTSHQGREGDTDNRSSVRDLRDLRDIRKLAADVTSKSRPDNILLAICPQPVFFRLATLVTRQADS